MAEKQSLSVKVQIAEPSGPILIKKGSLEGLGAEAQGAGGVRDSQAFQVPATQGIMTPILYSQRTRWVPLYRRGCGSSAGEWVRTRPRQQGP